VQIKSVSQSDTLVIEFKWLNVTSKFFTDLGGLLPPIQLFFVLHHINYGELSPAVLQMDMKNSQF